MPRLELLFFAVQYTLKGEIGGGKVFSLPCSPFSRHKLACWAILLESTDENVIYSVLLSFNVA